MVRNNNSEYFSNKNKKGKSENKNYLYPVTKLGSICAKNNLQPSFMPKSCYVNGVLDSYANCMCEDINGNCKVCYPKIVKNSKNSSVVYNANKIN
jgi:hypothetical protein